MGHVNNNWKTPNLDLIRAAETSDRDIDSGDIVDLMANTSDVDGFSFFNDSFFDYEAFEPRSKNCRIDD